MFRGFGIVAGLVVAGCSMPAYVKTAYFGDLPSLKREIGSAAAAGRISRADVLALAEAVVRRELRSAQGDEALERIMAARPCVRVVAPELRERAESTSDDGAEAMLVLAEAGQLNPAAFVAKYANAPSGAFRALAARGTGTGAHTSLRRGFYVDPDQRVRREALRAAADAADPSDLDAVLEAARLDPDPMSKSLATRAVGRIGGARAAIGLGDLWANADDTVKVAIVDAWAIPGVFGNGGRDALLRTAEASDSMASVSAAAALVRIGGDAAPNGRAVLARGVREGTPEERIVAIELSPLSDSDVVSALTAAADSDDASIRVVALARLLEVPAQRQAALAKLAILAKASDGAARQARLALAAADDPSVAPLLERDLASGGPSHRERAAVALFRLGKAAQMAPSLADPDPSVRMAVACSLTADHGPT